jgi:hypothetical protein
MVVSHQEKLIVMSIVLHAIPIKATSIFKQIILVFVRRDLLKIILESVFKFVEMESEYTTNVMTKISTVEMVAQILAR